MEYALLTLIVFVAILTGWLILSDVKRRREHHKNVDRWLAEESKKPKFVVKIVMKNNNVIIAGPFRPSIDWRGSWPIRYSSEMLAKEKAIRVATGKSVISSDGEYYPTSSIDYIKVEQEFVTSPMRSLPLIPPPDWKNELPN